MPRTQPPQLYLGVDVGTTGTKVAAIDADGHIRGRAQAGYRLDSPQPGLYLQDATDWQKAVSGAVRAACAGLDTSRVAALAISAQGGTLVGVDAHLQPLGPSRSWLDRRATNSAETFARVFGADDFYRRTGWPIAPNNTAAQLLDLASSEPELFAAAACFCDTASFINGWLTGTPTIDANIAGITQLLNVASNSYDQQILEVIGVTRERLPAIALPGEAIGSLREPAAAALGLPPGVVVGAGAHDQYCAALGAGAINEGDILLSTGTAWVLLAAASGPYRDPEGRIGSGRHPIDGLWGHFGEVSNGGVSIDWARRLLSREDCEPPPIERLDSTIAAIPRGSAGLFFFPFFDGTSPFDRVGTSQGSFIGLSLLHEHRHLLRAVAEGVAYAARLMLDAYATSLAHPITPPVVVGGATRSGQWMQLLADILGSDLSVSREPDSACVGAAMLAATAAGDATDVRSSVRALACPRTLRRADPEGSQLYDAAYDEFRHCARGLSDLYAPTPPSTVASP